MDHFGYQLDCVSNWIKKSVTQSGTIFREDCKELWNREDASYKPRNGGYDECISSRRMLPVIKWLDDSKVLVQGNDSNGTSDNKRVHVKIAIVGAAKQVHAAIDGIGVHN